MGTDVMAVAPEPVTVWVAPFASGTRARARAMARAVLAARCGLPPDALDIDRTCEHCGHPAHGRPRLVGQPELHFNLSHSEPVAAVALAHVPVGVDVEVLRPRRALDRLAARLLPPDELECYAGRSPEEQLRAFYRCWTAREAVAKARGTGVFAASARDAEARGDAVHFDASSLVGAAMVGAVAVATPARPQVEVHRFRG
jgi:4'-phosphopantetheinyl transferase